MNDYLVTGPTASTATLESNWTTQTSGSISPEASFPEFVYDGHGDTKGAGVASQVGSSPSNSAEHLGTSPNSLVPSAGLLAALGGMAVHPLSFAGPDVAAEVSPGGTSLWLEESYQPGGSHTQWMTHPSGIGYRRSSAGVVGGGHSGGSGSGSGSSGMGPPMSGNSPMMDSGTSDGSDADELTRLNSFDTGANENANATQAAPTSRAEKVTNTTPSAANANGDSGGNAKAAAAGDGKGGGSRSTQAAAGGNGNSPAAGNSGGQAANQAYGGRIVLMPKFSSGPLGSLERFGDWWDHDLFGLPRPSVPDDPLLGTIGSNGPTVYDSSNNPDTGTSDSGAGQPGAGTSQQAPINANPSVQSGPDLNRLAGYAGTFATHFGTALATALVATVVIGGFLLLAAAAGPVASGVAATAGVILLVVGFYQLVSQGYQVYSGKDEAGATLLTNDRVALAGDVSGGLVGALLGGKVLKGFNDIIPKNWAGKLNSWLNGGRNSAADSASVTLQNCFPPDTLVGTETGLRPMSQVGSGERVWAYDFEGGIWRLCEVECRHDATYDGPMVTIGLGSLEISVTAHHPFWVVEGWDLENRPSPRHFAVRIRNLLTVASGFLGTRFG